MRKILAAWMLTLSILGIAAEPKTVVLEVRNMVCELCPLTVKKALEQVSGVQAVEVDFASKTATVTYDPEKTQPEVLIQATTNAGYPASVRQ
jgi:mercuric ion binding protein